MSEEEAIKEIEDYLDYEGSVSIQAIATLYTSYNKEKEKNESLEQENNFLKQVYRGTDEFKAIEKLANKNY